MEGRTGLMSLLSAAKKSHLLTTSFSAVSMFTSTVLLACRHKHTHRHNKDVSRRQVQRWCGDIAAAKGKPCLRQRTQRDRTEWERKGQGRGGRLALWRDGEKRHSRQTRVSAFVFHISSPSNMCVCSGEGGNWGDDEDALILCRLETVHLKKRNTYCKWASAHMHAHVHGWQVDVEPTTSSICVACTLNKTIIPLGLSETVHQWLISARKMTVLKV